MTSLLAKAAFSLQPQWVLRLPTSPSKEAGGCCYNRRPPSLPTEGFFFLSPGEAQCAAVGVSAGHFLCARGQRRGTVGTQSHAGAWKMD